MCIASETLMFDLEVNILQPKKKWSTMERSFKEKGRNQLWCLWEKKKKKTFADLAVTPNLYVSSGL